MAVLLRTPEELYPVLASFYALGAKRGGWIVHRSRPGEVESDRAQLVYAGLNVAELEAAGTLSIVEFDMAETPEQASTRWLAQLDAAPEGRKLKLRYKDGEKTVVVPESVPIVTFKPADRSLLVPGAKVIVFAQLRDGKPTAMRALAGRNGFAPPM